MNDKPIYVTEPYLPPLDEFIPYLEQIWASKKLTNNGPMHQQLEAALRDYLGVPEIALFNNGTIALLTALQALRIGGEVITTPFSFVATGHSLLWNGITPVFVDIDPQTFNLDPEKIEAAITPRTTAIMPVHCYGNPCDVAAIQEIADTYNLKVIYDAAHAFGVEDEGGSILRHGDLSAISFHATKVFNTFEGGAIVCPDAKTKRHIDNLKNFGIVNETTVVASGINGKMSEINAAFGLLQLKHIDGAIRRRAAVDRLYRHCLKDIGGIYLPDFHRQAVSNYAYFPVRVGRGYGLSRDELYERLRAQDIYARRYFYPLISDHSVYRGGESLTPSSLSHASRAADEVICLPMSASLSEEQVEFICQIVKASRNEVSYG
ncbi:DegT/DnrJ/EryC1/StrS aminotransferase family protein [Salinicola sp. DM10]|uniref:DegT/DnrJ/EryC1/StrS family aminotransferase n=1 Tax=Salinicola sp. DM10 TaxID=2815721 RepID=UPI001A8F74E5|nr:DegT/DnrJ/EryC1/StrS family aminotransferase [Salinicola sp. DM10]MCE3025836.1 DegT/DnrJ/EryC1/StrS family aminotransferase [Salinicola sp. DM10]